jgi:hypothetical protein
VRLLAVVALFAACGGGPTRDLQVVSWLPEGAIDRTEALEIRFDQAVVPERLVGTPAAATSVTFTPPIAWRGTWRDQRTLAVEPLSRLAASTRYRVTLAGELRTRAGERSFSFVHQPLVVDGVWGADASALAIDGDIPLAFDQPVRPDDAAAHCVLVGDRETVALAATGGAPAPELALRPTHALAPGAAYTLACAGLTGAEGNAPLEQPYTLAVRARPELAVARIDTATDPDAARIAVAFTTPVTVDAARDAITALPAIPGLDRGTLSADGLTYTVTADLASETDYRISIADLVDRYGQRLAHRFEARFHTRPARPRIALAPDWSTTDERGAVVWTRDVEALEVSCVLLARELAVAAFASGVSPALPPSAPSRPPAITTAPPSAVLLAGRGSRLAIADHHWHEARVACGGPGVYAVEARAPGIAPARTVVTITGLELALAPDRRGILAWVTASTVGRPIAGAHVTLLDRVGNAIASEVTDSQGIAELPPRSGAAVIVAELDGDLAIAAIPREPAPTVRAAPSTSDRFALAVRARAQETRPGERLVFELVARTFEGAPVRAARVEWEVRRRRHDARVAGFEDFAFADETTDDRAVIVGAGVATADPQGSLAIAVRDRAPCEGAACDYELVATARDGSDGSASARLAITARPPVELGMRATPIAPAAGAPFEVALVAIARDGAPVATTARVTIAHLDRACETVSLPAGEAERCRDDRRVLFERDIELPAGAAREERVELGEPGLYVVRAQTRDGAAVARAIWIPAPGPAQDEAAELAAAVPRAFAAHVVARSHTRALVVLDRGTAAEPRVVTLATPGEPLELATAELTSVAARPRAE